jgi:hypothetical protein
VAGSFSGDVLTDIIPSVDNTYIIGATGQFFKDIYVNNIYIGATAAISASSVGHLIMSRNITQTGTNVISQSGTGGNTLKSITVTGNISATGNINLNGVTGNYTSTNGNITLTNGNISTNALSITGYPNVSTTLDTLSTSSTGITYTSATDLTSVDNSMNVVGFVNVGNRTASSGERIFTIGDTRDGVLRIARFSAFQSGFELDNWDPATNTLRQRVLFLGPNSTSESWSSSFRSPSQPMFTGHIATRNLFSLYTPLDVSGNYTSTNGNITLTNGEDRKSVV